MKRPLALFGFSFLLALLLVGKLAAGLLLPLALLLAAAFVVCLFLVRGSWRALAAPLAIVLAAAGFAAGYYSAYNALRFAPLEALDGATATVTARVEEVAPVEGSGGESNQLELRILTMDGAKAPSGFRVRMHYGPEADIGDVVQAQLRFTKTGSPARAAALKSKGQVLSASLKGEWAVQGQNLPATCRLRLLRNRLGAHIQARLPRRLSSVAVAMALGDKRFIGRQVQAGYRAAGISHLLVVSGLHLSVVSGSVYWLAERLTRRRRLSAAVGLAAVCFFMLFTGLTPSVVRSGVVWILLYTGRLAARPSDSATSMGLAALLLCLANPNAAQDAGLLLSFSATAGALLGAAAPLPKGLKREGRLRRVGAVALRAVLVALCTTLATLPVLALFSFGVSVFTLPANLLAVPLMSLLLPCCFVLLLPVGFAPLEFLLRPFAFVAGWALALLEGLAAWCARRPWGVIALSGGFLLAAVLVAYGLAFLAAKTPYKKTYAAAAALVLPMALCLHLWLAKDTVTFTVAGSGAQSSLVVTQGGEAVVLYRGRQSAAGVQRVLQQERVQSCVLMVDLRQTAEGTEYETLFRPQAVYMAGRELTSGEVLSPLPGIDIYLKAQGDGRVACVDVGGYKLAVATGKVDLAGYAPVDVLLAGSGEVRGHYKTLLVAGEVPEWAAPHRQVLQGGDMPQLQLRPGKSLRIREAEDGFFTQ